MRGYHAEEITALNDEELDNLIRTLIQETANRREKKKEELIENFYHAWEELEKFGIEIHYEDFDSTVALTSDYIYFV